MRMVSFDQLSTRGQIGRLRNLAMNALTYYDLTVVRIRLLTVDTNTLFTIDTNEGRFVLRISVPDQRDFVEIQSEVAWLAALRQETGLIVPEVVRARSGDSIIVATATGIPDARSCVLFRWIEGQSLNDTFTATLAYRAGTTLAQLHDHADHFQPPMPFSTTTLDQAWPFGLPTELTDTAPTAVWTAERRALLLGTGTHIQAMLDTLYANSHGRRFLHLDFHPGNLKVHRHGLAVLDFDDTRWAYPVQDIGIALYYVLDEPDYAAIRTQFLAGYRHGRPDTCPSDQQIDWCIAARQLDLLSYVCAYQVLSETELAAWIPQVEQRLRRLLPTEDW